jgi:hypothetical protein
MAELLRAVPDRGPAEFANRIHCYSRPSLGVRSESTARLGTSGALSVRS